MLSETSPTFKRALAVPFRNEIPPRHTQTMSSSDKTVAVAETEFARNSFEAVPFSAGSLSAQQAKATQRGLKYLLSSALTKRPLAARQYNLQIARHMYHHVSPSLGERFHFAPSTNINAFALCSIPSIRHGSGDGIQSGRPRSGLRDARQQQTQLKPLHQARHRAILPWLPQIAVRRGRPRACQMSSKRSRWPLLPFIWCLSFDHSPR